MSSCSIASTSCDPVTPSHYPILYCCRAQIRAPSPPRPFFFVPNQFAYFPWVVLCLHRSIVKRAKVSYTLPSLPYVCWSRLAEWNRVVMAITTTLTWILTRWNASFGQMNTVLRTDVHNVFIPIKTVAWFGRIILWVRGATLTVLSFLVNADELWLRCDSYTGSLFISSIHQPPGEDDVPLKCCICCLQASRKSQIILEAVCSPQRSAVMSTNHTAAMQATSSTTAKQ